MERLTKKEQLAGHEVKYVSGDDCFDVWSTPKKFMGSAIDRLAAYEDTGLEPEEVEQIKLTLMGKSVAEIKEFEGIPIDRMKELAQAERAGRLAVLPCRVGDTCWVVEQDEDDNACDIGGYVFIAEIPGYVIVAPTLNGSDNVKDIMEDQVEQTARDYHGDLAVFSESDVYQKRDEAEEALREEAENG